jgi:polar amino acid transport system substrate-binding protein
MTMQAESTLAGDFAPTGVLRVAINLGNALLAKQASAKQPPHGVSVDLANELAQRLHLPLELICVDGARRSRQSKPDKPTSAFLPLMRNGVPGCTTLRPISP